ncbi:MAG: helix-turn-helix domain-containing protein [Rickettsiaceae bacterium]|nr:helix-turn-helix domain-containing protein [Rickettsiaceae bacterium]
MANTKSKTNPAKVESSELIELLTDEQVYETIFKKKRLQAGICSKKVSKELRIKHEYLIAIEEDDLEKIPGKVYAEGYKKIYANYLNIDLKELDKPKTEVQKNSLTLIQKSKDDNLLGKILSLLSLLSVLTILFLYMFFLQGKIELDGNIISKLGKTTESKVGDVKFPYEKEYDFSDLYDK